MPFFLVMLAVSGNLDDGLFVLPLAYCIGLIGVCLIGVPVHYIFRYIGVKKIIAYVLVGFISPACLVWGYNFFTSTNESATTVFFQGIIFGVFGAICAYVFRWCIYKKSSNKGD